MNKKGISIKDKESIEILKKIIEENPESSIPYFQLAEIYARIGDHLQAGMTYLSYALRIEEINENTANKILKKAKYLFEKVLEKNPKDSDAYSKLASTYSHLGKHDKAIQFFKKAIKIAHFPWDYFYLAREYCSVGELHNSAENYMIAGKEDQKKYGNYFNRGSLAFDEAATTYKEIIKNKPHILKDKDYFNLGYASLYCSKYSYEDAANAFKQAIHFNPKNEEAYYYLALSYEEIFDYKGTLKTLNKLIEINPKHPMAYYKMNFNYEKLGNNKKAKESLREALRIDPSHHFDNLRLLSYIFKDDLNQIKEGVKLYKEALELRPDYAPGHYDLGELYLSIDDQKNAKKEFEILKKLDKEHARKLHKLIKRKEMMRCVKNRKI